MMSQRRLICRTGPFSATCTCTFLTLPCSPRSAIGGDGTRPGWTCCSIPPVCLTLSRFLAAAASLSLHRGSRIDVTFHSFRSTPGLTVATICDNGLRLRACVCECALLRISRTSNFILMRSNQPCQVHHPTGTVAHAALPAALVETRHIQSWVSDHCMPPSSTTFNKTGPC